uniref:ANL14 n=1 Tax=Synechococcus elongatus (strain ATCC 33912 / PCC 7942 / FACHB-805) TaxID=1140 RepID=Q8KUW0_SYNE7|nr:ANL14 [Synechococcus elongatus PCC 7942 = FACHB-805]
MSLSAKTAQRAVKQTGKKRLGQAPVSSVLAVNSDHPAGHETRVSHRSQSSRLVDRALVSIETDKSPTRCKLQCQQSRSR